MLSTFRSIRKQIASGLMISLGVMWLSFAIAPCAVAAAIDDRPHNCCPQSNDKTDSKGHASDQETCNTCNSLEPMLNHTDEVVQPAKVANDDFQLVLVEYAEVNAPVFTSVSFNIHSPPYLPVHPTLRFCSLLI